MTTDDLVGQVHSLSADIDGLRNALEDDLETILNHPCHIQVEDIDPNSGKVVFRVELDLAKLREKLNEREGYEDLQIGINDDFTFEIVPEESPGSTL